MKNSEDPDHLALSEATADLDLYCFQKRAKNFEKFYALCTYLVEYSMDKFADCTH